MPQSDHVWHLFVVGVKCALGGDVGLREVGATE